MWRLAARLSGLGRLMYSDFTGGAGRGGSERGSTDDDDVQSLKIEANLDGGGEEGLCWRVMEGLSGNKGGR